MVPNHVFTLLSMVAMEPPAGFDAASIRTKKAEVFAAMPAVKPAQAVRGQYGAGTVLGKKVKAYRQEPNVAPDSQCRNLCRDEARDRQLALGRRAVLLRTGKHMSQRSTEIAICFKQAPYAAFQDTPVDALRPNWLVLRIAPDEGISLQFEVKRRGPVVDLAAVKMDFHYDDWFPKEPNVGYETLLYDVHDRRPDVVHARRHGRAGLARRAAGARRLGQGWRRENCRLIAAGSAGPGEADKLLARDGRRWRPMAIADGQSS